MDINYSYHNHTKRCGHAYILNDEEYIKEAKNIGIKYFGFSDHIPFSYVDYPNIKSRMLFSELNEYIESINKLKCKYKDIVIKCGLEVEYDDSILDYLKYVRSKLDYMILGEHFVYYKSRTNNSEYPIMYAKEVCKGIESGLFSLVAHPDIFIRYESSITNYEDKIKFNKNTLLASDMICKTASKYDIPLELSLEYTKKIGLPTKVFWEYASKYNNKVLIGIDAHNPYRYRKYKDCLEDTLMFIKDIKLNIIDKDYIINDNYVCKDIFNYKDYYINKLVNLFNDSGLTISEFKELLIDRENNKYSKVKDEISKFKSDVKEENYCLKDKLYLYRRVIRNSIELDKVYKYRMDIINKLDMYINIKRRKA